MCVIIVKKKGVKLPSKKELRAAYDHNPHGCGFCSSNGIYWRGMSFEDFYGHLKEVGLNDSCIIHFRLATHGSHKESNCHPFYDDGVFFAHNGVLPVHTKGDMTDSETVFKNILSPAIKLFGINSDTFRGVVARNIYSSKFAFMQNGDITLFGPWIEESNGLIWSNLNHRSMYYMGYGLYNSSNSMCIKRYFV